VSESPNATILRWLGGPRVCGDQRHADAEDASPYDGEHRLFHSRQDFPYDAAALPNHTSQTQKRKPHMDDTSSGTSPLIRDFLAVSTCRSGRELHASHSQGRNTEYCSRQRVGLHRPVGSASRRCWM